MAITEHVNFQPADPMMDRESFSQLMGHVMRWAKDPDVDPCIRTFTDAIAPIYGNHQNNSSILLHVSRILSVIVQDARFRFDFSPDKIVDLLMAPWRIQSQHVPSLRDDKDIEMTSAEYVNGMVVHLWTLIRNSPTARLTDSDFKYQFDPAVLALMRYVKKNGTKDVTVRSLGLALQPVYGLIVGDLMDLTIIVVKSYIKAAKEPAFQLPAQDEELQLEKILAAPTQGPFTLLGFSKRYGDLRRVEDFYISIIKHCLSHFAVAKVDWCMAEFEDLLPKT